jgi:hypothetical protein
LVVITEVFSIINMYYINQFKIKQSMYTNSCCVVFLYKFTLCCDFHVMKQPVLRKVVYCCLL